MHAGTSLKPYLIAVSPQPATARRKALVERMAKDLVHYDAAQNEQDAVRCLMARGYSPFDVLHLVPEARALAFQEIVAVEMSKP